jgi:hypothetical protein
MNAISGSLLSQDVIRAFVLDAHVRTVALRLKADLVRAFQSIGPASGARTICDIEVLPVLRTLGLDVQLHGDSAADLVGTLGRSGRPAAGVAIGAWGSDLRRLDALLSRVTAPPTRWSVIFNGAVLRIGDRSRTYARRTVDVDLRRAQEDDEAIGRIVRLLEPDEDGWLATLERAVADSDAHRSAVGASLQAGVEEALGHLVEALTPRRRRHASALERGLADALTIVYRILFLLFAEARGLVPHWHPIYRNSYTIEALRPAIERSARPPGVWQALQAIARLAHRGCRAGTLRVTPFNGRLFAPAAAPLAETATIDDRRVRDVLFAITTRPARDRRERISYADLGVEQLGAVYERVLDFTPTVVDGALVLARSGRRKATGTFYTPRGMTEYLVRRTLAPLVGDRSAESILQLRVLDPAMGSGAFLVAACRFLADAYERALIREGALTAADPGPSDRAVFRRVVAQRCLYGVDRNPTAVQLARLSLWLCTLAADRPLTFLDHHLRTGNSLVGAAPHDIMRQPPGKAGQGRRRQETLPLFEDLHLSERLGAAVLPRLAMDAQPDDTADIVRHKERTLAQLDGRGGPLESWRALADAWCAAWFWPEDERPLDAAAWGALSAAMQKRRSTLPPDIEKTWTVTAADVAVRERFFHWELEFPEVFFDSVGNAREKAGFDAIVGNPPWDALRTSIDSMDEGKSPRALTRFSRDSGCYRLQSDGHANLYQLFTERALRLLEPHGRMGLLLPSGLITDHGCAQLRRTLLHDCRVDALLAFDNRHAIFPIHRGVRFVLLTAERGGTTHDVCVRFGLHSSAVLGDVPDEGAIPDSMRLPITMVEKFSGPGLAFPELHSERDRQILARILASVPRLDDEAGWNCRFGRELNATDDRRHFGAHGLPVLEGKLIDPFRVNVGAATMRIPRATARRLLGERVAVEQARLGYREVAASTNRLTLIAAMIPADAVTTHTVFCLKGSNDLDVQWFLCGVFNSFVANYLIRLHGGTHVTASMMRSLPVPLVQRHSETFERIGALSRALAARDDAEDYAELQARTAALYDLNSTDFAHILSTFPLVALDVRRAAASARERYGDAV